MKRWPVVFAGLFVALLALPAFAQAEKAEKETQATKDLKPDELVKKVTDDVLASIKSDKQLAAGDREKALKLAEEKVLPHIDFEEATRLAVGRSWKQASKEQQEKIVTEFRRMLVRTYSSAISRY